MTSIERTIERSVTDAVAGTAIREMRQLTGRAMFRALLKHYRALVQQARAEMDVLAGELAQAALPATLQVRRVRLASGAVRQRLSWRMRGQAHVVPFERVRESFPQIPAPLHRYLDACQARVQELNAIEAIFRYAASQLETYLASGTVKVARGGSGQSEGRRGRAKPPS